MAERATKTTILVAGLGSIGRRHARLISERDDTELLVCDPVEQFVSETQSQLHRPAAGTFADYDDALGAAPDVVFVCTPNHLHVPMGLQAVAAGADLMVEKPIAHDLAEARRLIDAVESAGRFCHVGYMLRFDPALRKIERMVREDAVGELVGGRAMIGTYITLLNARSPDRERQPNALIVDYTHELDFLRWIFGDIARVVAAGATRGRMEKLARPNVFQMILTMASGALVNVHMDYVQYPQRRVLDVFGDRGTLSYDFMTGQVRRFRYGATHQWESLDEPPLTTRVDDLHRNQIASILSGRADGLAPVVSGRDGLAALAAADAAIRAAETERPVALA